MATIRLPRLLDEATRGGLRQDLAPGSLAIALGGLFASEPALRHHLLDEDGAIRPHVLIFVDGRRADLTTAVADGSEVIVLQAVSGGDGGSTLVGRENTNQMA